MLTTCLTTCLTKTDDNSNTLFSDRYQQTYHSTFGAQTESTHVFLHGSGVHDRLCANHPTRILEIGFGLGLNCLLCADSASSNNTYLSYTGIEHAPINSNAFIELNYGQLLNSPVLANNLAKILCSLRPNQLVNTNDTSATVGMLGEHCKLTLHTDDATSPVLLEKLKLSPKYDAIFLDAFSPDVNPECWTQDFMARLRPLLAPGGRLATYCVKGSVRRSLLAAGFTVNKYPGPKGKREVLWAHAASTAQKA